jgi:hypothetical protein
MPLHCSAFGDSAADLDEQSSSSFDEEEPV